MKNGLGGVVVASIVSLGALLAAAPSSAQEIDWRVEQRFRLFAGAGPSADKVERLLTALKAPDAASGPADLARHYGALREVLIGEGAEDLRTANWDTAARRYKPGYLSAPAYDVSVRLVGAAPGQICDWRVNDGAPLASAPCADWTRVRVPAALEDGRRRGRAAVSAERSGLPAVVTPIVVEDELVVALGDSFIAGEGNPDVPAVFSEPPSHRTSHPRWMHSSRLAVSKARFWDTPCHRSLTSYPVLTSLYMAAQNDRRAVTLVHLGCSGAEAREGIYDRQREIPGSGKDEAQTQVEQLQALLAEPGAPRTIDRLLLSLGGNDVGFASVVQTLALPTGDYRLPFGPNLVGAAGGAVCPYTEEWPPLSRLCPKKRPSAEQRLATLPAEYDKARTEIAELPVAPERIIQTQYPDILRYRDGRGELQFCSTGLNARDLAEITDPAERERERAYAEAYPGRVRVGFEALNGVVPWFARLQRPYFFQFKYYPEPDAPAGCDDIAEPSDSEVCQAYWVWRRLNAEVERNGRFGWKIVGGHVARTAEHGWCAYPPGDSLALPLSTGRGAAWTWSPEPPAAFDPYREDLGRWFRTPNDSARAQWHGKTFFHQGTVHPTFRAHVAFAEAVLNEAIYPAAAR